MNEQSNMQAAIEVLNDNISKLKQEKKRMESLVKQLASEVEEAQIISSRRIAKVKDETEAEIAELQQRSAPYKDLVQQCETAARTLEDIKRKLHEETAALKAERHTHLAALDQRIKTASDRLARLHSEEEAFRKRIALV